MPHPRLLAQNAAFPKRITELAQGLFAATGYAASNAHLVAGEGEAAIVDTTESTAAAENVLAAFRDISEAPVTAIHYTHGHRDHISGASVFAGDGAPEITASSRFASDLLGPPNGPRKALMDRTRRQFGFGLEFPGERVNLGCGPGDRPVEGMGAGFLPPTRLIAEERSGATLAGHQVEFVHAPGETPDHLMVWFPGPRVLISGDNYYQAFPNLYAIRGTPYRDFDAWADSLGLMLELEPEVLAPGHTLPVFGREAVAERLTDYRDAIRFVTDATAEAMDSGEGTDAIAARLRLPERLAGKPWLAEVYGKLAWSARAYATGTLGWFDGNPTNLDRLPPVEEAQRMISLAGGAARVLAEAEGTDDPQWTLELVDRLLAAGEEIDAARAAKARALCAKAEVEENATARNTYLVCAKELEGGG